MRSFYRALLISTFVEAPIFLGFMMYAIPHRFNMDFISELLIGYHIVGIVVTSFVGLLLFGHGGPSAASVSLAQEMFFFVVFVIQVALTMPIYLKVIQKGDKA